LPIGVANGDADDLATTTVTIKGLKNSATITDNLDGTVFSSSTVTLTAAEVNSGLTFHPGRLTSGTLTVTASMTEGGGAATSAPLTISLSDPPVHRSHGDILYPSDDWRHLERMQGGSSAGNLSGQLAGDAGGLLWHDKPTPLLGSADDYREMVSHDPHSPALVSSFPPYLGLHLMR
jgi:hypothetical protein